VVQSALLPAGVILSVAAFQAERRACPELAEGISVSTGFAREPLPKTWIGAAAFERGLGEVCLGRNKGKQMAGPGKLGGEQ
jgi:hypothetical protein